MTAVLIFKIKPISLQNLVAPNPGAVFSGKKTSAGCVLRNGGEIPDSGRRGVGRMRCA